MAKISADKILMAIGFVVGGIGTARMFGDLPDDMKAIKEKLQTDDKPTEEKAE